MEHHRKRTPEETARRKNRAAQAIAAAILISAAAVILIWAGTRDYKKEEEPAPTPILVMPSPEVIVKEVEVEKLVQVEKEITASMLEESLKNMGVLISQSYNFTEVIHYSSTKQFPLLNVDIPFSESGYIVSYEGSVSAGVDFTDITVEKDAESASIKVHLPPAKIFSTEIDFNSFTIYDEKHSAFNPLTVENYNEGLKELEQNARKKAQAKGLLDQANSNARALITAFLEGSGGADGFRIYYYPKYT